MSGADRPVLITGAAGFIGRQLHAQLAAAGVPVVGVDRHGAGVLHADLSARAAAAAIVRQVQPAYVFHLAGAIATADADVLHRAHMATTERLFTALAAVGLPARVLVLGTAAEYGALDEPTPIAEGRAAAPTSPYGASKLAQGELAAELGARYGIDVLRARLFNTLGAGQTDRLVAGAMVRRLREALQGARPAFEIYDPHSVRDFLDVRDVARLLWLLMQRLATPPAHAVHLASGVGTSIGALAALLLAAAGPQAAALPVAIQPGHAAPTSVIGAPTTLLTLLDGASPAQITPAAALRAMWEYSLTS